MVMKYFLVMQLFQKGVDELHEYQEHTELRHPKGDDFVFCDGFDEDALKLLQGSF
jgi:hypothetical protein